MSFKNPQHIWWEPKLLKIFFLKGTHIKWKDGYKAWLRKIEKVINIHIVTRCIQSRQESRISKSSCSSLIKISSSAVQINTDYISGLRPINNTLCCTYMTIIIEKNDELRYNFHFNSFCYLQMPFYIKLLTKLFVFFPFNSLPAIFIFISRFDWIKRRSINWFKD